MGRNTLYIIGLCVLILVLFAANLFFGSISIPSQAVLFILSGGTVESESWRLIVLDSRYPQAITALFTGSGIAVSGLLLQTVFRNPLADSSILGISSGASLGVAVIMLFMGGYVGKVAGFELSNSMAVVGGAFAGALLILAIIIGFSTIIKNNIMLLIIGIMVGYLTSSVISILKFWSSSESAFSYMIWGLGSFSEVLKPQLLFYCSLVGIGLLLSFLLVKPLNAMLLGDTYASNLGVNVKRVRLLLLLCAGLLTAVTTAYCGPIAFIGLAVPHMARLLLGTSNHSILLPVTLLLGGAMALLCNVVSVLPASGILPLNAITPIFGAPVIIYVIINQKRIQYFN